VAAACATGVTRTSGLDELRVKESDRLALMARGLAQIGVSIEEREDGLVIHGCGGDLLPGGNQPPLIEAALDHRIAMSFAIAGLNTKGGVLIDDMSPVATSFPGFQAMLDALRAT
jgi:3-phosphoshikimate 1-carboxyvinyltransferase